MPPKSFDCPKFFQCPRKIVAASHHTKWLPASWHKTGNDNLQVLPWNTSGPKVKSIQVSIQCFTCTRQSPPKNTVSVTRLFFLAVVCMSLGLFRISISACKDLAGKTSHNTLGHITWLGHITATHPQHHFPIIIIFFPRSTAHGWVHIS